MKKTLSVVHESILSQWNEFRTHKINIRVDTQTGITFTSPLTLEEEGKQRFTIEIL